MATVVIASSKAPRAHQRDAFIEEVRGHAQDAGVRVAAMKGMDGPGCYNLGLRIEGDERRVEAFVNGLTLALGPIAKWGYCADKFEGFVLEDLRE